MFNTVPPLYLRWIPGIWSPSTTPTLPRKNQPADNRVGSNLQSTPPLTTIWNPTASPTATHKEFRPVKFESPVPSRKIYSEEVSHIIMHITTICEWEKPVQIYWSNTPLQKNKLSHYLYKMFPYLYFTGFTSQHTYNETEELQTRFQRLTLNI